MPASASALRPFIQALPKTETHLHLEGGLPFELLQRLDPVKFAQPPASWAPAYRFGSFGEFDQLILGLLAPWFTSPARYHEAAAIVFRRLADQNVRYVETSFHLPVVQFIEARGEEILQAILEAVPAGMTVRVFAGLVRDCHTGAMPAVIADALQQIANHFGVEKPNRHFHQLDQEIGYDTNINTCTDVK